MAENHTDRTMARSMMSIINRRRLLVLLVVLAVLAVIAWLAANPPWLSTALPDVSDPLKSVSGPALADEKIRREIVQLELANRQASSPWGLLLTVVPITTAIVGGLAIGATIWKEISERHDRLQKELVDREIDAQRQFTESFRSTIDGLSNERPVARAAAALSLGTFLRPEYSLYHDQVLLVTIAKVKGSLEDDEDVHRLDVRALERAMRAHLPQIPPDQRRYFLDLNRCKMERIDLSGLDLSGADLAFADLSDATLQGADLHRIRGYGVNLKRARIGGGANLQEARLRKAIAPEALFHDARCISIRLEEADLRGAEFYRAKLQEARFEGADLTGAKFRGADINNAFFKGAILDETALDSIARGAANWRKARFDPQHMARLEAIQASVVPAPATTSEGGEPARG